MAIIYVILLVVAILLVIPLFISNDMNYEKSILIDASIIKVWENVSSLSAMDQWSPWNSKDPDMEQSLTGIDGVGEGSQTIVDIDKPNQLSTKLEFIKPFKSEADAYVRLKEGETGTMTTWGFESQMAYPMNIMKLFMNFEKNMDKDFGAGLEKLKSICEK